LAAAAASCTFARSAPRAVTVVRKALALGKTDVRAC
jgi:hypothetical protein